MDWRESARRRLPEHLDSNGDLVPPWAQFPDYGAGSIGWRMGAGEDWMGLWAVFLEGLGEGFDARLAYLKRHPPAPESWARSVHGALHPGTDEDDDDHGLSVAHHRELLDRGLIASDAAYPVWLAKQDKVRWPWLDAESPEECARYWTRPFSFWSRQIAGMRGQGTPALPDHPPAWRDCAEAATNGVPPKVSPEMGFRTLALLLCSGDVLAPWQLGLQPSDFADSYDEDVGYVDAFQLWTMSTFDDRTHFERYLAERPAPAPWTPWLDENLYF